MSKNLLISFELSYIWISQYAISCQFGKDLIFLSSIIQPLHDPNAKNNISTHKIPNLIFFCLNSFFVNKNFAKYIIRNKTSINTIIENITVTDLRIKLLISFRFIHKLLKNLTSSTVFAFITTNVINAHHTINAINAIIHK
ncbi:MAG: hypothetical protein Q8S84_04745 [bacterium]|nr:hypothetical protein [bacterium]MDP3380809.1 hypothetical protein [bacterium]